MVCSGLVTFGSGFVPIGKTVGTFCVLYVPAKCFLGWLGTNRCHFVPAILLAGTNRCLFVPVVPLVPVGPYSSWCPYCPWCPWCPWCLWFPSARTARGARTARRPVLLVVPVPPVGPYCPWVPTTRKEPTTGRSITRKPERKEPTPGRWQGLLCICSFCQCSSCSLPAQLERFCLRR